MKKRPKSITKEDIGDPFNFRHVAHVGWNKIRMENIREFIEKTNKSDVVLSSQVSVSSSSSGVRKKKAAPIPPQNSSQFSDSSLNRFFKEAGVSQKQLEDEDTRKFIYDFLNRHNGWKVAGKFDYSSNNSKKKDQDNQMIEETGIYRKKSAPAPPQNSSEPPDSSLNTFFEKAGVSQKQLKDEDFQKFIYDWLNTHDGMEVVEELGCSSNNTKNEDQDVTKDNLLIGETGIRRKKSAPAPPQNSSQPRDSSVNTFFKEAGGSQNQLKNEDSQKFIDDWLNKHYSLKIVEKLGHSNNNSEKKDQSATQDDLLIEEAGVRKKKSAPAPPQNSSQSLDSSRELNAFFKKGKVSEKQLKDDDTQKFFSDFLNKHDDFKVVENRDCSSNNYKKEDQDVSQNNLVIEKTGVHRKSVTLSPPQNLSQPADSSLNELFKKAGITQKQLEDKDTRKFIYDFLNKHGGWKVAKKLDQSSNNSKKDETQDNSIIKETEKKTNISDAVFESLETQDITRENESQKPLVSSTTYSIESCENKNLIQENTCKSITPIPAPRRLIQKSVADSVKPISKPKAPVPSSRSFNVMMDKDT